MDPDFNFWRYVVDTLTHGGRIDYLICDEAQFFTADQVDQLARVVDDLQIDVFTFGILTDFRTKLFPGSARLVAAGRPDREPAGRALCWCGSLATHNIRTIDGEMVTEGDVLMVGDVIDDPDEPMPTVAYEVVCRQHHRRGMTARRAALFREHDTVLPFED